MQRRLDGYVGSRRVRAFGALAITAAAMSWASISAAQGTGNTGPTAAIQAAGGAPLSTAEAAARFGALEDISDITLSPDGSMVAFITPSTGRGNDLFVASTTEGAGTPARILRASGDPERIVGCNWATTARLVCMLAVDTEYVGTVYTSTSIIALDAAGGNLRVLSARRSAAAVGVDLRGGRVIDWLPDTPGNVLIMRSYVASEQFGAASSEGMGVDRVDVTTGRATRVERARPDAVEYITDGHGTVRIMATQALQGQTGQLSRTLRYYVRPAAGGEWQLLSRLDVLDNEGFVPVMVDRDSNRAIGYATVDGRQVVAAMALDGAGANGSSALETLFSHPEVDVDGILTAGQHRQIVGATFVTEKRQVIITDGPLRRMTAALERALPGRIVYVVDTTVDNSRYLVWAGSDTDPGQYYLYAPAARQLRPLMRDRLRLADVPLAVVQPISYPAADGTAIPGYLTLPPGRSDARGLPAIVMPHGGPSARDEWGFDWLAQFFANRGFAVLQPNFRGSSGYGDAWYQDNGFQSWRTAVGDVVDAGRWLVGAQGADPAKLSIVGWSYGGYAALQSGVIAPDVFRSIVAIAPVTDLAQLRQEESRFVTGRINADYIGDGPHIREGSPAQNAAAITAPVLMFHGSYDQNVDIAQSRTMRRMLTAAGRSVELVEYPNLAHSLATNEARQDMLTRIMAHLPRP